MIFDTDAVPGIINVALHKFSNYPGLFFKPKSTQFAYSVTLHINDRIQVCGYYYAKGAGTLKEEEECSRRRSNEN